MAINPSQKDPYHGLPLFFFINIAFSLAVYFAIGMVISKGQGVTVDQRNMDFLQTLIVASGTGLLLTLSLFIAGLLKEPFAAVKERVSTFFEDVGINFKQAVSWWWYNVKKNGIAFWLLTSYTLLQICVLLWGIRHFLLII